jgi:hypothetical protein
VRRAHPILGVYDRYQRAEILALRGERHRAEHALTRADRAAERADTLTLPDWGYWYVAGFWGLQRGLVLTALGRRAAAVDEAAQGLAALPAAWRSTTWIADMLHRIDPDWT